MSTPADNPVWPGVLFRAAVVPTAVVGVVAAGVAGFTRGSAGAAGALLGAFLVVVTFGLGLLVARRTAALHPVATMTVALTTYVFTITVLLLVLVLVRRFGGVDSDAVGLSLLVCVFVWLAAQLRAFLALPLFLDPGDTATAAREDPVGGAAGGSADSRPGGT